MNDIECKVNTFFRHMQEKSFNFFFFLGIEFYLIFEI